MPFKLESETRKARRAPPKARGTLNHNTLYKVVSDFGGILHGWYVVDHRYESQPDKNGESGWNIQHSGALMLYESGFHVTTRPRDWYNIAPLKNYRVFEVEYKGAIIHSTSTSTAVVRQFRFVREVYPNHTTKTGFSRRKPK